MAAVDPLFDGLEWFPAVYEELSPASTKDAQHTSKVTTNALLIFDLIMFPTPPIFLGTESRAKNRINFLKS